RGQLSFQKDWSAHDLNVLLGSEMSQDRSSSSNYRTYGYDPSILTFGNVDYVNRYPQFTTGSLAYIPKYASINSALNRYVSVYGNASYSFKKRYILSLSARKDGSNLFGV